MPAARAAQVRPTRRSVRPAARPAEISARSLDASLANEEPRFFRDYLKFAERARYLSAKVLTLGHPGQRLASRDRLLLEAALGDTSDGSIEQLGRWFTHHLSGEQPEGSVTTETWSLLSALGASQETFVKVMASQTSRWDNSAGRYLAGLDDRHLIVALRQAGGNLRRQRRLLEFLLAAIPERVPRLVPAALAVSERRRKARGESRYQHCVHPLCELLLEAGGLAYEAAILKLVASPEYLADRVLMMAALHRHWPERNHAKTLEMARELIQATELEPATGQARRWAVDTFSSSLEDLLVERAPYLERPPLQALPLPGRRLVEIGSSDCELPEKLAGDGERWRAGDWLELWLTGGRGAGYIWAEYDAGGTPLATFRVTDGRLCSATGETVQLTADSSVGLAHAADLAEEQMDRWRENLDLEALGQLDRPVSWLDPARNSERSMADWEGYRAGQPPSGWAEHSTLWFRRFSGAGVDAVLLHENIPDQLHSRLERLYFVRVSGPNPHLPRGEDDAAVLALEQVPASVYSDVVGALEDATQQA